MICTRCGSARRPDGPVSRLDAWGRDCLHYACTECGYSWNVSRPAQALPEGRRTRTQSRDSLVADWISLFAAGGAETITVRRRIAGRGVSPVPLRVA